MSFCALSQPTLCNRYNRAKSIKHLKATKPVLFWSAPGGGEGVLAVHGKVRHDLAALAAAATAAVTHPHLAHLAAGTVAVGARPVAVGNLGRAIAVRARSATWSHTCQN